MNASVRGRHLAWALKVAVMLVVVVLLATPASAFFLEWAMFWKYIGQNIIKYLTEWGARTAPYVMAPGIVLIQINPCVYSNTGICPAYTIEIFNTTLNFALGVDPGIRNINVTLMRMLQIWYIVAIIILGAYLIFMAGSPHGRANAKDAFVRLVVGMVLVSQSPILFQMMLDIERLIADTLMATTVGAFQLAMRHLTFFVSAKYCCTMWILMLVTAVATVLGAFRYFLVYVMACFFPLTLFMYFTDIPNPFFSLRGLGTRLFKFTIMLFIIQILQVLMLATGMIIASSGNWAIMNVTERLLHFLLMTAAFGGILLTPMIGMQLMSWIGAVIHITSTRPSSALTRFVATWMRTGNIGQSLETASGQYMIGHSMGDHVGGEATGPSTGFRYAVPNAPITSFGSGPELDFPHTGPTAPAGFKPSVTDFGPGLYAATGTRGGSSLLAATAGLAGTVGGGVSSPGGFTGGAMHMPARRAGASAIGASAGVGRFTSSSASRARSPGGSISTQYPGSRTARKGVSGGGPGVRGLPAEGGTQATEGNVKGEYAGGTAYSITRPGEGKITQGETHGTPGGVIPGKGEMVIVPPKPDTITPAPMAGPRLRQDSVGGKELPAKLSSIKSSTVKPRVFKKPEVTAGLSIGDNVDDKTRMHADLAPRQPTMSEVDRSRRAQEAKRFNEDMVSHQKTLKQANDEWRKWERMREDANRKADGEAAKYAQKQERKARKFAEGEELKAKRWAASYLRNIRGYNAKQADEIVDRGGDITNLVLADPKLGVAAMADSVDRASARSMSEGRGEMSQEDKAKMMGSYMDNARRYHNLEDYGSTRGEAGRGPGKPTGAGKENAKKFRHFIDGELDPAQEGKAPADPVEALDNIMESQDEYWSSADKLMDNAVLGNLAADQYLRRQAQSRERRREPAAKPVEKPKPSEPPVHTPEELERRERRHRKRLDDEGERLKKKFEEQATEDARKREELLEETLEKASFQAADEKSVSVEEARIEQEKKEAQAKQERKKQEAGEETDDED
jgi:hypothetical protein